MKDIRVGFALCGSFCTHRQVLSELEKLCGQYRQIIAPSKQRCAVHSTAASNAARSWGGHAFIPVTVSPSITTDGT